MEKIEIIYTDEFGNQNIGQLIEIDNNTLIYKDKYGVEKATSNYSLNE